VFLEYKNFYPFVTVYTQFLVKCIELALYQLHCTREQGIERTIEPKKQKQSSLLFIIVAKFPFISVPGTKERERENERENSEGQIKSPEFADPARPLLQPTFSLVFTDFVPNANTSRIALIFTFLSTAFQLKNTFAFHYLISLFTHTHTSSAYQFASPCVCVFLLCFLCFSNIM